MYSQIIKDFINGESLPLSYLVDAEKYFIPLVNLIINKTNQSETAPIVGISGAQGTGKTSLSELLEKILKTKDLNVVKFSIDDFYLTKNGTTKPCNKRASSPTNSWYPWYT